jgi:UDP-N-acetyl-D-mannosaminuronate dehydrogenase
MKVGIIGMGEIGTANKEYLEGLGHEVFGYDIDHDKYVPKCDIYLICTSSDAVEAAVFRLRREFKEPLISIESTIRRGTCVLLGDVIYCPQRYWRDDPYKRGVRRDRLIAATSDELLQKGVMVYSSDFDMTVSPVSLHIAELAKIAENAYRGVQIAFAQELHKLCPDDFAMLRAAINSASPLHWIAEVRDGIKGHCIPMAMDWLSELPIVKTARESNERFINEQYHRGA